MDCFDDNFTAGLFEGEGTISIGRHDMGRNRYRYELLCSLKQSGKNGKLMTYWLKSIYGGGVCFEKKRKKSHLQGYRWFVGGQLADKFLREIYPSLRFIKKRVAELAMEFWRIKKNRLEKTTVNNLRYKNDVDKIMYLSNYETIKQEIMYFNQGKIDIKDISIALWNEVK